MKRPTKNERLELEALYEAFLRAWDALAESDRVGYAELRERGVRLSKSPLWALFNRKSTGGPSREALLQLARAVKIPTPSLLATAKHLAQARREIPLPFKDGKLPRSAGDISPMSFIIEKGFTELVPFKRRDLLSEHVQSRFPYSLDLLNQPLHSEFTVVPDRVLPKLLAIESVDESQPQVFGTTLSTLRRLDAKPRARLQVLKNWTFRMSPDFAIIAHDAKNRRQNGRDSFFQRLALELDDFDDALEIVCSDELANRIFMYPALGHDLPHLVHPNAHNVRLLLSRLGFAVSETEGVARTPVPGRHAVLDSRAVIRFALHHLRNGHFRDNILVVGGAPHYWAARWAPGLDVILTDEDLFGVASPFERCKKESDREFDKLRKRSEWWSNNKDVLADTGDARSRWKVEDRVLAFREELKGPELQASAKYFRARFQAAKLKLSELEFSLAFAAAILNGYQDWGGIGVGFAEPGMQEFVDEGIHLHEGDDRLEELESFAQVDEWISPLHDEWFCTT